MARRCAWALVLVIAGCGPELDAAPAGDEPTRGWAPVCGTEGAHRLLPLAAGEHAYRVDRGPDGDRFLFSTFIVDSSLPLSTLPPTLDLVIHAAGPCGEDPVEVAHGLVTTSRYGELSLACSDGGHGAWVIDPTGVAPPRSILEGWCPLRSTPLGLVTVQAPPNEDYGTLVLLREPADPQARPEPVIDDVRTARNTFFGPGPNASTSLWVSGGEAIVLDRQGVVWHVELDGGELTEELVGVRELRVSADARWMVWQALEPRGGDEQAPVGPVFVRDREAGTDRHLLDTHLEWTGNPYAGDYLVVRDDIEGLRLYWLDGLAPITLPRDTDFRGVLDDGVLWLVRRVDEGIEELRWRPGTDEAPVAFARHDGVVSRRAEGIEIFETDDIAAPNEGSLHYVPFSGGAIVELADHVHERRGRLADGRILTIVDEDETGHGPLRLIDPELGAWELLDGHGYVQSPRLGVGDPFEGDVVFARAESEGGARGVYRARVPREP